MMVHRSAEQRSALRRVTLISILGIAAVLCVIAFSFVDISKGHSSALSESSFLTVALEDVSTFDSHIMRKQYVPLASKRGLVIDLQEAHKERYIELVLSKNKWHIYFSLNGIVMSEKDIKVVNDDNERKIISVPAETPAYDSIAFVPLNGRNQFVAYLRPIKSIEDNVLGSKTVHESQTYNKNPSIHDITGALGFFVDDDGENIRLQVQSISEWDILLLAIIDDKDRIISTFPEGSILETVNTNPQWLPLYTTIKTGRNYQLHRLRLQYRYIEEDGSSDPAEFKTSDLNPFMPYNDEAFNGTEIRIRDNLSEFNFVEDNGSAVRFKSGYINIDRMLFVPQGKQLILEAGQTIDLSGGASIFCRDAIQVNGTADQPVRIISTDGTGHGLVVVHANRGLGRSTVNHLICDGLSEVQNGIYALTGCITFYESDTDFFACQFLNNKSEDGINTIRSNVSFKNCKWYNTFSDAYDADFCAGSFDDCYFELAGNDGIDISTSNFTITNCEFKDIDDKCISVGEHSIAKVENIYADTAQAILGVKDLSEVHAKNITGKDVFIGYLAYQKKPEYGNSVAYVENLTLTGTKDFDFLIEKGETYYLDGRRVFPKGKKKEALIIQKIINEEPILR